MEYVIVFILAVAMVGYAKENIVLGCLGVLILLGMGIMAVDGIFKFGKAFISATWRPMLVALGVLALLWLVNFVIEHYVSAKSNIYSKIKKLYEETKNISKPSNIKLLEKPIILNANERPEEVFFVEYHDMVQSQLDLIKINFEKYERIRNEKDNILRECKTENSKVIFEKYVVNRYARRVSNAINGIPDTFKAEVLFSRYGETSKIQYSFAEIEKFNDRYYELEKSLKEKRQKQIERAEAQRRREEQQQREAEECEAAKKLAEERRREEIKRERSKMSASLRYDVMKRDHFRCTICGRSADDGVTLHVDHIKPVSKGGKTEMSNLRTLCDYCNLGKSDKYDPNGMN